MGFGGRRRRGIKRGVTTGVCLISSGRNDSIKLGNDGVGIKCCLINEGYSGQVEERYAERTECLVYKEADLSEESACWLSILPAI